MKKNKRGKEKKKKVVDKKGIASYISSVYTRLIPPSLDFSNGGIFNPPSLSFLNGRILIPMGLSIASTPCLFLGDV